MMTYSRLNNEQGDKGDQGGEDPFFEELVDSLMLDLFEESDSCGETSNGNSASSAADQLDTDSSCNSLSGLEYDIGKIEEGLEGNSDLAVNDESNNNNNGDDGDSVSVSKLMNRNRSYSGNGSYGGSSVGIDYDNSNALIQVDGSNNSDINNVSNSVPALRRPMDVPIGQTETLNQNQNQNPNQNPIHPTQKRSYDSCISPSPSPFSLVSKGRRRSTSPLSLSNSDPTEENNTSNPSSSSSSSLGSSKRAKKTSTTTSPKLKPFKASKQQQHHRQQQAGTAPSLWKPEAGFDVAPAPAPMPLPDDPFYCSLFDAADTISCSGGSYNGAIDGSNYNDDGQNADISSCFSLDGKGDLNLARSTSLASDASIASMSRNIKGTPKPQSRNGDHDIPQPGFNLVGGFRYDFPNEAQSHAAAAAAAAVVDPLADEGGDNGDININIRSKSKSKSNSNSNSKNKPHTHIAGQYNHGGCSHITECPQCRQHAMLHTHQEEHYPLPSQSQSQSQSQSRPQQYQSKHQHQHQHQHQYQAKPSNTLFQNVNKQGNTGSQVIGVTYNPKSERYRVRMKVKGKTTHLGYFPTEEEASRAYDRAAIELRGLKAKTNFPYEEYDLSKTRPGTPKTRAMSAIRDE